MSNTNQFTLNKKIVIGIASGSIAAAIIVSILLFAPSEILTNDIDVTQSENPIVAEINEQEIRLNDVQDTVDTYISQGQQIDKSTALDQMIVATLLLEEAQKNGINVTMEEAADQLNDTFMQSGLSEQQFEQRLEQLGTNYDDTLTMYRDQLIINEMLTEKISNADITVSDEEAMLFYDQNLEAIQSQLGNNTVYDDVSSQIKSTIQQQKTQQYVSDFIEELKNNAMILTYKDRL